MVRFLLINFFLFFLVLPIYGQEIGDYRSVSSGNWNDPLIWEVYNNLRPGGRNWYPATNSPDGQNGKITSNVDIRAGHTVTGTNVLSGPKGSLTINGNFITDFPVYDGNEKKNFPLLIINGTLVTNSYVNAETLDLSPAGIFETGWVSADQTEGWWFSNTVPGSVNLEGTVRWSGPGSQVVATFAPYYNLEVYSDARTFPGNFIVNAELTIQNGGRLVISENTDANLYDLNVFSPLDDLILESNNIGTGSLIFSGALSGNGNVSIERFISPMAWHLISVPILGYNLGTLVTENTIDQNSAGTLYALRTLDESSGTWTIHSVTPQPDYNLNNGEGFYTGISVPGSLQFRGQIHSNSQPVLSPITNGNRGWNAVGNPFTSSIGITIFSTAGTNCFLSANAGIIDPNDLAVYVYDPVNNNFIANSSSVGEDYIQVGQGFMVRATGSGGNLVFNAAMQEHNDVIFHKKSATVKDFPGITITVNNDDQESSAKIIFAEGTTRGLDPSWDIRGFGDDEGFHLYSRLVEDNGLGFNIQCLPGQDFASLSVALGFDFNEGGLVRFTAEHNRLPDNCKVFLEDRDLGIYTDLSRPGSQYVINMESGSKGIGRFYFHGFNPGLEGKLPTISMFSFKREIFIQGELDELSEIYLYDISGRLLTELRPGKVDHFSCTFNKFAEGLYVVRLVNGGNIISKKIFLY